MNFCKKCTGKPYSFLVIDATLASVILHVSEKHPLERIKKLIMTIDDRIRDEN